MEVYSSLYPLREFHLEALRAYAETPGNTICLLANDEDPAGCYRNIVAGELAGMTLGDVVVVNLRYETKIIFNRGTLTWYG